MKKYILDLTRHFKPGVLAPLPKLSARIKHRPAPIMDRDVLYEFDDTLTTGTPVQVDWEHLLSRLDYHKGAWWCWDGEWREVSSYQVEQFLYLNGIGGRPNAEPDRDRIWAKLMFWYRDRKSHPMGELPQARKPVEPPKRELPPKSGQLDLPLP